MKLGKRFFVCLLSAVLSLSVLPALAEDGKESTLFVRKAENLPDGFFMGMDVSSVLAEEASGVTYYDAAGNERDLFDLLAENGVNLIRVRVWNDPFDSQGRGYGGGNNDISAAVEIGKRATAAGMGVMIDFHYSDFWADPGKQMVPKAWKGLTVGEKAAAAEAYTLDCLNRLRDAGVNVVLVQVGNETNGMLCGERDWKNIGKIMNAGAKAVRAVFPEALVAVHFANPENGDAYRSWAARLQEESVDYDVFASSYYPYWHGTLDNLKTVLSEIASTYSKKVMVAETSYAYTAQDGDFSGNSIGEGGVYDKPYPFTVQGQANEVADVIRAMADIGGIGVCYWEGAWVPVGTASWEQNSAKWETFGSGWAASYAKEYDPDDAGKYYGGSACDNQALFDFSGKALPSLAIFRLVRTGNEIPLRVDALEEVSLVCDIDGNIALPKTVPAIISDNTRRELPIRWDAVDTEALKAAGEGTYVIHGTASSLDTVLNVTLLKSNFLKNGSFEEEDRSMWKATDYAGSDQLYAEDKKNDSLTGSWHWHFYSANANTVNFNLEQEVTDLPAGQYTYRVSIQGGDAGKTDVYSYVKINGETVATEPTVITRWAEWHTPVISGISVNAGDTVTVGIHVTCDGAGAWGKIDDAELVQLQY